MFHEKISRQSSFKGSQAWEDCSAYCVSASTSADELWFWFSSASRSGEPAFSFLGDWEGEWERDRDLDFCGDFDRDRDFERDLDLECLGDLECDLFRRGDLDRDLERDADLERRWCDRERDLECDRFFDLDRLLDRERERDLGLSCGEEKLNLLVLVKFLQHFLNTNMWNNPLILSILHAYFKYTAKILAWGLSEWYHYVWSAQTRLTCTYVGLTLDPSMVFALAYNIDMLYIEECVNLRW